MIMNCLVIWDLIYSASVHKKKTGQCLGIIVYLIENLNYVRFMNCNANVPVYAPMYNYNLDKR